MKIGIDGRSLQGRPWGGVGQYTYGLLRALFELDPENEYVIWYNAAGKLDAPNFSEYLNVRALRTRWPNKLLNAAIKVSSFKFPVSDADLFFMPNLNFIALPAGTKLVLTVHDLSFEHFPEHYSLKSRLWHRAIGPRALLARADQVIAVSEHTKGDLVETYGIRPEKISVVYPGITSLRHSEEPQGDEESRANARTCVRDSSAPVALQNDDGERYILYFGALEPRKNIEGLIAAFEALTLPSSLGRGVGGEWRGGEGLVLAGLSTPYTKYLKRRIAKSPLRERIGLVENPSEEEKWKLYTGARLFVYPSFYEGFGFPPLEAMAAGVPVVASSASAVPEVCGDAAVLVSPWKVDEIVDGMRVLLEDENLRRYCVEAGYRKAAEFSWPRCAKQTLDILRQ